MYCEDNDDSKRFTSVTAESGDTSVATSSIRRLGPRSRSGNMGVVEDMMDNRFESAVEGSVELNYVDAKSGEMVKLEQVAPT